MTKPLSLTSLASAAASGAPSGFICKIATEEAEFEQIHRLNYRTFVEEIPQHRPNSEGRLVDRFHAENTYVIALHGARLVGMMALRGRRPFSLDQKLPDLDKWLPAGRVPIEVRLLAVEPEYRRTTVFKDLFEYGVRQCLAEGYDIAVISGTVRQLKLYGHLGFTPFGPTVGSGDALYQPMYLTLEAFGQTLERSSALRESFSAARPENQAKALNFLPGPVSVSPEVRAALQSEAVSHRGRAFLQVMAETRAALCRLTNAREAQIVVGSGSLANEMVAAQLSLAGHTGLVVSNGEFGERLAQQARRAGLTFDWLRLPWGETYDLSQVEAFAARLPSGGWVWAVWHETSTGVLNPIDDVKRVCARRGLRLCVDAISAVGAIPVDLSGAHLATAVSGKGLGSYPGLGIVFHDHEPQPAPERLPGYLDLGHWAAHQSVPHTHSSNLVFALAEATRQAADPARLESIRANAAWLRGALREAGFRLLAPERVACPAITTLVLEPGQSSREIGEELEMRGYWLSYRSGYLLERNWLQISLMGNPDRSSLERLARVLRLVAGRKTAGKGAKR